MVDVVYKVKPSEVNEELRYSIRSVYQNWPEARITIAGYKPSWLTGVNHIDVLQKPHQKHQNANRIVKEVLLSLSISEPFWFMDDDMFILQKSYQPIVNWGLVEDVIATYGQHGLGSSHHLGMIRTLDILRDMGYENPISYACHTPLLTYKDELLKAMDYIEDGFNVQYATIYGNQVDLGGIQLPSGDVKVHDLLEVPGWVAESPYVSTSDRSFSHGMIGRWLRNRFTEVSPFEVWTF